MPYIGQEPLTGRYIVCDDLAVSFDGSTTTFTLQTGGQNIFPQTEQNCIISISGIYQYPVDAYTISGSSITFTSAPLVTDTFSGVVLGDVLSIGTPTDSSVNSEALGTTFYVVNQQTMSNVTIEASENGMVAGPFSVTGTLSIASGATFVIV